MSFNHKHRGSKRYYKSGKGKKAALQQKRKDTKGYWEYSHFQKIEKPNEEEKIKGKLSGRGGFDPFKTQDYINPPKSKEELILEKLEEGKNYNEN